MSHKNPALGVLFALSAAILFGLNASTTKVIIGSGISPEQVVFIRSLFTGGIALTWVLLTSPKAMKVPARMIPRLLLLGVIGVGLLQWSYSQAVFYLPIGIALLLEYTAVLWVPIIALIIFKEKVRKQIWLGAALVLGGLAVVAQIWDSQLNALGVFYAFLAAGALTVHLITGERIQRTLPTNVTLAYGMSIATLFFLPLANIGELDFSLLVSSINLEGNLSSIDVSLWVALTFMGIFGSFMPMALTYLALRNLSATLVGVVATAETILAALFALLWLGELISLTQFLGSIVVIAGILLAQTARESKEEKADK